ncbi:S-methyl-5-thioribose kinase [Bacillus sp. ISL-40]|uniref:S-methyl-5-thioribose kinase n=1 Tax=unclassified Bacillus (in: firmicutes) TaxID=185979 RepID=UPI001BE60D68|nr:MULTISPECIES: S-methyl-5-thioribose kinase [unclassified Bacillus (in: firmicutes)]MBT2697012.1 S-methyl-5-thioribose kinase [Bacillus sp. ISL-40]MBT2722440.1 S-methyl-5-thioribose kinase [Bacillus sp. ISL-46]MBT2741436.1 S-methyl-5-thioribose kinase [Bacillus sp. ISL-77]
MSLLKQKTYQPLTNESAVELALELKIFDQHAKLSCKEIGDGNLNLVFHIVEELDGKSVIIKQALPYAKVVGESWPLTLKRAKIEADALKIFGQIAPDYVPQVFFTDDVLAVTVMEDLSHLSIARTGFIKGETYPLISKHLGEYLAKTLFYTSDYGLTPSVKKEYVQQFINPELCKITEDLIFTDPFIDAETNDFEEGLRPVVEELWQDDELKFHVNILKKCFLTEAEVLLHGDLHTGSVFADNYETKVIDPEFSFYGPAGFDIGQVIANLLFQVIANVEERDLFLNHIETVWSVFEDQFTLLWNTENKDDYAKSSTFLNYNLTKFFEDSIGFAGCELIRRTIGLAHVADLDGIEDAQTRFTAKQKTLGLGKVLIKQRKEIKNLTAFIATVKETL